MSSIVENFKLQFPFLEADAVRIEILHIDEMVVELKNGEFILYDDQEKTFRVLPSRGDDITEDIFKTEFGYRLRKIMTRKHVTQEELSKRTGIPRTMLSSYITGRNIPSFYKADMIARALGCSTDEFRYIAY